MFTSRLEYPNGHCLCEIISENSTGIFNSGDMILLLRFKPSRYFGYHGKEYISVHNCYGNATINGVSFSEINCPSFFRVSEPLPVFKILLSPSKIKMIEDNRGQEDVKVRLDLNILFSLGDEQERFYCRDKLLENNLVLYTEISKSDWLDKHLVTWKYYSSNELIVQTKNINEYEDISDIMSKCRKNYFEGRYEEVLREGYILLETVPKKLGYKDLKKMFDDLCCKDEKHLKDKYTNLNKVYGGIKNFTNLCRHGKTLEDTTIIQNHINKNDARFFLTTIEVLIDYLIEDLE